MRIQLPRRIHNRTSIHLLWQITSIALTDALGAADPAARKRVFAVMMGMKKIDIAAIEAARL